MANYLFAFAKPSDIDLIVGMFQKEEVTRKKFSENFDYIYVSKNIDDEVYQDQSIFKGYAIDYSNRKLFFNGGIQAPDILSSLEGCYLRAKFEDNEALFCNDAFAQLSLIFSKSQDSIIISDSFFIISKIRERFQLKNTLNEEVAIARSWLNSITAQQLSSETIINDIQYCPPGNRLIVKENSGKLSLQISRLHLPELFDSNEDDYNDTIKKGAEHLASILLTYSNINNAHTSLSISGGLDSRVCLAAALASGDKDKFRITSSTLWPKDYAIAEELGRKFDFSLTKPASVQTKRIDPFLSWVISSCGIYDPTYSTKNIALSSHFGIGGHGAETLKGNYGWRPINSIIPKNTSDEVAFSFQNQAKKGLLSIGVQHDDLWGSEWHYIGYRNAIHSGRSTMTSLLSCRPILQQKLIGLSRSSKNMHDVRDGSKSIVSDLLISLSPELARTPFDNPTKNMSSNYVSERYKSIKADPNKISIFDIIGDPENVSKGPPESFINISRSFEFSGGFQGEKIKRYCMEGYEKLPSEIQKSYYTHIQEISSFTDKTKAASLPGMAAGKLLMFNTIN